MQNPFDNLEIQLQDDCTNTFLIENDPLLALGFRPTTFRLAPSPLGISFHTGICICSLHPFTHILEDLAEVTKTISVATDNITYIE